MWLKTKDLHKYLPLLGILFLSCEPELSNSVEEREIYTAGEADFSRYVALGNSLSAGYADGALYITGQENSYPGLLAQQFSAVQFTDGFVQPLMADNAGGLLAAGVQILPNRLVLAVGPDGNPTPQIYIGMQPTTDITNVLTGPFNNMAVPGAKSFHLLAPGYGDFGRLPAGAANPYFVRFASSPQTTVLADALAQDPTFFSLWIGSNDVLAYAVSGGTGVDRTGNLDPLTYGSSDITDPQVFASMYSQLVEALTGTGAKGVLINLPDVTAIPFFTTVPNNALLLDPERATGLTRYFQAVSEVFRNRLIRQGVPPQQAEALASQYALTFNTGPNRFIVDVPVTPANPLGFRQMKPNELLLLSIDRQALGQGYGSVALNPELMQVLQLLEQGGEPTRGQAQLLLDAVNGIDDRDALDEEELENISVALEQYNTTITNLAEANGLALADARSLLNIVANEGLPYDAGMVTSDFISGGAFSLDGIHPTPRGGAAITNMVIRAINSRYDASVPEVNIGAYGTITPNNEVQ